MIIGWVYTFKVFCNNDIILVYDGSAESVRINTGSYTAIGVAGDLIDWIVKRNKHKSDELINANSLVRHSNAFSKSVTENGNNCNTCLNIFCKFNSSMMN